MTSIEVKSHILNKALVPVANTVLCTVSFTSGCHLFFEYEHALLWFFDATVTSIFYLLCAYQCWRLICRHWTVVFFIFVSFSTIFLRFFFFIFGEPLLHSFTCSIRCVWGSGIDTLRIVMQNEKKKNTHSIVYVHVWIHYMRGVVAVSIFLI